ncbi:hypothetical protein BDV19DRAFT_76173 [Aspergillus venezuelensis]
MREFKSLPSKAGGSALSPARQPSLLPDPRFEIEKRSPHGPGISVLLCSSQVISLLVIPQGPSAEPSNFCCCILIRHDSRPSSPVSEFIFTVRCLSSSISRC